MMFLKTSWEIYIDKIISKAKCRMNFSIVRILRLAFSQVSGFFTLKVAFDAWYSVGRPHIGWNSGQDEDARDWRLH